MTRRFATTPIPHDEVHELLDLARRAPSAGYSQGVHLLALQGEALADFWRITGAAEWFADVQPGVLDAPVVVLPLELLLQAASVAASAVPPAMASMYRRLKMGRICSVSS